ncbi:uncharacterized protein LOC125197628 [Salvia hispanica]|uniref:uncharacterized protein LOC125197628 n=1 Tax=Salvia hispanica TaxID=49212 RepID=UPI002009D50C|nr:uncharacterized protein LOC125197628 [Salvia hispanica]
MALKPCKFRVYHLTNFAKEWFECLPTEQVSTWKDIVAAFLDKYYPPGTILKLKSEIFQFIQRPNEPLYVAVARFKGLLRKCPNHGFTVDQQVGILYNSFNKQICAMLDSWGNKGFLRKSGAEAMAVIEEFATNSCGWSKERHQTRRVAVVEADEESSLVKELAELKVRVNQMDTSRREDPIPPTSIIAITKPDAEAAPIEDVNYVQQGGSPNRSFNNNNYRPNHGGGNYNNYNGNRPHPNLSYSNNNFLQPPAGLNASKDRKTNDTKIGVLEARLNNLEAGINTLTTAVTSIKNQMDQVQQKLEEDKKAAARVADINKKWVAKQKKSTSGAQTGVCPTPSAPLQASQRAATVPAETPAPKDALVRHNGIEIPRYAKLLREAVMRKKKPTKADLKLPLHCSEIIQREKTVKQRDPGQFIIKCSIGQGKVDKALCDLGASINIMPLKYYEKLNIGPLMKANCMIRFADNSTIKAVGMIEDVLVKVDDFISR